MRGTLRRLLRQTLRGSVHGTLLRSFLIRITISLHCESTMVECERRVHHDRPHRCAEADGEEDETPDEHSVYNHVCVIEFPRPDDSVVDLHTCSDFPAGKQPAHAAVDARQPRWRDKLVDRATAASSTKIGSRPRRVVRRCPRASESCEVHILSW